VKDHLRASGLEGAAAAQIAAHRTRDAKELLSPEEVLRQHGELAAKHGQSVEAYRIFAQLQESGMRTVTLKEIVRQKDPELKQTVEQLARGEVGEAIADLEHQGRVHEVSGNQERIAAIAREYAKSPENTLAVSPDNRSRAEINRAIHTELQSKGMVGMEEYRVQVLVPRQDLTGADRAWAERYNVGDVLRYSRASKETCIRKCKYARVASIDSGNNRLTVELRDGTERTYDPRRWAVMFLIKAPTFRNSSWKSRLRRRLSPITSMGMGFGLGR